MNSFVQGPGRTHAIDFWHHILAKNPKATIAAFAYVTDSGAAQMYRLKKYFRHIDRCRWIFGIDYGRSHPTAIRKISELAETSEVRIFDGAYVVNAQSFTPRKSFHLKTIVTVDGAGLPCEQLVGSGNLSGLGLTNGIEAGCLIDHKASPEANGTIVVSALEQLWNESQPFGDILDQYAPLWAAANVPIVGPRPKPKKQTRKLFWIDVGYVTKNRGELRSGNQFDLPRGAHVHLGLAEIKAPARNSILGELKMRTVNGAYVSRALRFGNNAMEKLTLPIPEDYGYGAYDGKILTFERRKDFWILEGFEHNDFEDAYRKHIDWFDRMQSGRLFGTISI